MLKDNAAQYIAIPKYRRALKNRVKYAKVNNANYSMHTSGSIHKNTFFMQIVTNQGHNSNAACNSCNDMNNLIK